MARTSTKKSRKTKRYVGKKTSRKNNKIYKLGNICRLPITAVINDTFTTAAGNRPGTDGGPARVAELAIAPTSRV